MIMIIMIIISSSSSSISSSSKTCHKDALLNNHIVKGSELRFQHFTLQSVSAVKSPIASLELAPLISSFLLSQCSSGLTPAKADMKNGARNKSLVKHIKLGIVNIYNSADS